MTDSSPEPMYDPSFFDYINAGSLDSARVITPLLVDWIAPQSLLDVGCGVGAWCQIWSEMGVRDVIGVDGDYVQPDTLRIPKQHFIPHDLSGRFDLARTFDLVTSLEVAEHVPGSSSELFVDNLTRHGKRVLFSAAVVGQGGKGHINEHPLEFWRDLFAARGYRCFDPIRPLVLSDARVEPWYRYNVLLYVAESEVSALPEAITRTEIPLDRPILDVSPTLWKMRKAIVAHLPHALRDGLVDLKHAYGRRFRKAEAAPKF